MNHNVFFITTIDVADKENKTFTWRTPGFRYSLEDAKAVVEENMCDIFEYCYKYAVIEELSPIYTLNEKTFDGISGIKNKKSIFLLQLMPPLKF